MKEKNRFWPAVVPFAMFSLIFVLIPLCYVLGISFLTRGQIWGIVNIFTLTNYTRIIRPEYFQVFSESLVLAFITTLLTLLIGYPFGYLMAKLKSRPKKLVLLLIIVPFWTNSLVRIYGWMTILGSDGMINNLLMKLGLIDRPAKLLYTYGAVLIGMLYSLLPFMILSVYTSVEKLDWSVIEAARDLGAGKLKAFFTVTFKMTLPGVVSGCILVFVPSTGLFFISDLLGGSKYMLAGNLIKNQLLVTRDWPFGAALSVIMLLLTYLIIWLGRRLSGSRDLEVFES